MYSGDRGMGAPGQNSGASNRSARTRAWAALERSHGLPDRRRWGAEATRRVRSPSADAEGSPESGVRTPREEGTLGNADVVSVSLVAAVRLKRPVLAVRLAPVS